MTLPTDPPQDLPTTTPAPAPAPGPAPAPTPADVQEAEGEDINTADPQALAKLQKREQRLKRERDQARDELKTLREQQEAREQQMADEANTQTTEQVTNLTQERDAARNEVAQLRLEKELTGKVLDPEASIRLMGDGYRKQDGTLDLDAFLEKHPYMRPAAVPTAPNGGGGTQAGTGRDAEIETVSRQLDAAQKAGNRVLAVSLQSKLTALRQQQ